MQFVLQKAGEPLMGDFRYISFAVLMSSAVFFSAILGVALGEWKGTSSRTKGLLAFGVLVLAAGFAVMAVGGK
jgi:L-rhamnose-H+ transport protein